MKPDTEKTYIEHETFTLTLTQHQGLKDGRVVQVNPPLSTSFARIIGEFAHDESQVSIEHIVQELSNNLISYIKHGYYYDHN